MKKIFEGFYVCTRQCPYWQIAKYEFVFAWNGKKRRCNNTQLYSYLRNLVQNLGQISSTALVLSSIWDKKCKVEAQC